MRVLSLCAGVLMATASCTVGEVVEGRDHTPVVGAAVAFMNLDTCECAVVDTHESGIFAANPRGEIPAYFGWGMTVVGIYRFVGRNYEVYTTIIDHEFTQTCSDEPFPDNVCQEYRFRLGEFGTYTLPPVLADGPDSPDIGMGPPGADWGYDLFVDTCFGGNDGIYCVSDGA